MRQPNRRDHCNVKAINPGKGRQMSQNRPDPVAPADAAALAQARALLAARHAALAYADPETAVPGISRIAFGRDEGGQPLTLVSALAEHAGALRANPACAVLLGEVGAKGDPLIHPRLMLRARAEFVAADDPARAGLRALWLKAHPKAALYLDFADFAFVRLHPAGAVLNAGFGRACRIAAADLVQIGLSTRSVT